MLRILQALLAIGVGSSLGAASLQPTQRGFLENYCLDCHDAESQKGEIEFDVVSVEWADQGNQALWERVLSVLESGGMPPKKKAQPTEAERASMVAWIDDTLSQQTDFGGTLSRRLNQVEYQSTIETLFGLKHFELPTGFPADREHHGFDNVGEGLVLSPPLLRAYQETARMVADRIFPVAMQLPESMTQTAEANDLTISYSSGKLVDGAMRLGMKCNPIFRSCTWPSRIEAAVSGVYTVAVDLSCYRPLENSPSMSAKIFARDVTSRDSVHHTQLRLLQEIQVERELPATFEFEAELYEGQTLVVHWANALLDSDRDDKDALEAYFIAREQETPDYLAAWHAMVKGQSQGFRGGVGWARVKSLLDGGDLRALSDEQRNAMLKRVRSNPVLYAETVVFEVFETGPALDVHGLKLVGPHRLIDGPRELESQRLRQILSGGEQDSDKIIREFLTRAFRRPVDDATLKVYVDLHSRHLAAGNSPDEAMHLVVRNVLLSPRFLYRCLTDGPLDPYDLAARLSYFLTSAPPDEALRSSATGGSLTSPNVLRREAMRLLPDHATAPLIVNFTGQWLDTRLLAEIMPDPGFKFQARDQESVKSEVEYFFHEMLHENRPMRDFIDPDFTWTSARVAKNIYGLISGFDKKKGNVVHRVSLQRGGRVGGVLGQAAVMMATANGVDTQPVLRGAWVLENILGLALPPPPNAVPPITPDSGGGGRTPRELLAAHTEASSCAYCHRKIDPVGFVLENFDPVGRWRDTWPGIQKTIDASSTLPDGTKIRDIEDFKAWLVGNIDQFSQCLAEKLMTYATGRFPNYSERKEIASIVAGNHEAGNGFRDLVMALIESETFRNK
jgi:hypothetical protein